MLTQQRVTETSCLMLNKQTAACNRVVSWLWKLIYIKITREEAAQMFGKDNLQVLASALWQLHC